MTREQHLADSDSKKDLLALSLEVANRVKAGQAVFASVGQKDSLNGKWLVTDDCIRPQF